MPHMCKPGMFQKCLGASGGHALLALLFACLLTLTGQGAGAAAWTRSILQQADSAANGQEGLATAVTVASVNDTAGLVSALLNPDITTIRITASFILNGTYAKAAARAAGSNTSSIVVSRNVTLVGAGSTPSFPTLHFNSTRDLITVETFAILGFSKLQLRGLFINIEEIPAFITSDSGGTVRFSQVVTYRTACRQLENQVNKWADEASRSGNTGFTATNDGQDIPVQVRCLVAAFDTTEFDQDPNASSTIGTDGSEPCTNAILITREFTYRPKSKYRHGMVTLVW